jgi:hypothetical protein
MCCWIRSKFGSNQGLAKRRKLEYTTLDVKQVAIYDGNISCVGEEWRWNEICSNARRRRRSDFKGGSEAQLYRNGTWSGRGDGISNPTYFWGRSQFLWVQSGEILPTNVERYFSEFLVRKEVAPFKVNAQKLLACISLLKDQLIIAKFVCQKSLPYSIYSLYLGCFPWISLSDSKDLSTVVNVCHSCSWTISIYKLLTTSSVLQQLGVFKCKHVIRHNNVTYPFNMHCTSITAHDHIPQHALQLHRTHVAW